MYFSQVTESWTPKEQRSRDKWRQHLANFQVEFGLSREEMDAEIAKQIAEKIATSNTTTTIVYTSADQVLKYLFPPNRKKK